MGSFLSAVPSQMGPLLSAEYKQIRLMDLIVGNKSVRRRLAQYLTKSTKILIDHLHSAGNYGAHLHETPQPIRLAAALAYCFAAVELCHSLSADFERRSIVLPDVP